MHADEVRVGERVRLLRARLGLSRAALAELLHVSAMSLYRWEHGRAIPSALAWQRILQLDGSGSAPPGDVASARPRFAGSLIGRETEVAEIQILFASVSLLTLTGPGGSGKTRLAVAVAEALEHTFPDGIAFVSLATLSDPQGITAAIADVLGVRVLDDTFLAERVTACLLQKRLLLILDNFEHLLCGAAVVASLLEACPRLVIMVTSRERLHLQAETCFSVQPLPGLTRPPASLRMS